MNDYSSQGKSLIVGDEEKLIVKVHSGIGFPKYPDALKTSSPSSLLYLHEHTSGEMKEAVGAEIQRRTIMFRCGIKIAQDMHLLAFERFSNNIRKNEGKHVWVLYDKYASQENGAIVIKTRKVDYPFCSVCNVVPRHDGTASLCKGKRQ